MITQQNETKRTQNFDLLSLFTAHELRVKMARLLD